MRVEEREMLAVSVAMLLGVIICAAAAKIDKARREGWLGAVRLIGDIAMVWTLFQIVEIMIGI